MSTKLMQFTIMADLMIKMIGHFLGVYIYTYIYIYISHDGSFPLCTMYDPSPCICRITYLGIQHGGNFPRQTRLLEDHSLA